MSCDFRPLMLTTNPTPQESCSLRGSYSPGPVGIPSSRLQLPPLPVETGSIHHLSGQAQMPTGQGTYPKLAPDLLRCNDKVDAFRRRRMEAPIPPAPACLADLISGHASRRRAGREPFPVPVSPRSVGRGRSS